MALARAKPSTRAQGAAERDRLEAKYAPLLREELRLKNLVSYVGNRSVPILRLYRYKEAFAFDFVRTFMQRFELTPDDFVFDPFAGMGTTLFAAMTKGIPSFGIDKLPIAVFIARAMQQALLLQPGEPRCALERLSKNVCKADMAPIAEDVPIMRVAFTEDTLVRLRQWKTVIDQLPDPMRSVFLLLFFSILERSSFTSKDGQFLRLRRDRKPAHPDAAMEERCRLLEEDLQRVPLEFGEHVRSDGKLARIIEGDTRQLDPTLFATKPTAIITSPPYVNRYDYTRTYCLELCFHFVQCFDELRALRHAILRSHIESRVDSDEQPVHPAIGEVVARLHEKKLNNPRIPYMLIGYFADMERAIAQWTQVLADGARLAIVVDNVRFEGEMIPVDMVLTEMAEVHGFSPQSIIVSRYKGNSSQQMAKYGRAPVRESIVVWRKES